MEPLTRNTTARAGNSMTGPSTNQQRDRDSHREMPPKVGERSTSDSIGLLAARPHYKGAQNGTPRLSEQLPPLAWPPAAVKSPLLYNRGLATAA